MPQEAPKGKGQRVQVRSGLAGAAQASLPHVPLVLRSPALLHQLRSSGGGGRASARNSTGGGPQQAGAMVQLAGMGAAHDAGSWAPQDQQAPCSAAASKPWPQC